MATTTATPAATPRFVPYTASTPRFVPYGAATTASARPLTGPPTAPTRFVPVRPTPTTPPSEVARGLSLAKLPPSLLSMALARPPGAPLTWQPSASQTGLAASSAAASGALNVASGIEQLTRGRTVPGTLSMTAGAGQLAAAAPRLVGAPAAVGTVGQGLGAAAGLAGVGYGLAQGGQAGDRMAAESIMNLAATFVPGLGWVNLIGKGVETAVNAIIGEGPFAQTRLPFGRGNQFSSADNLASQVSKFRSIQGENMLLEKIQQAKSPTDLLAMAYAGSGLSPHGEIQFWHPDFGHGGDWLTPQDPRFTQTLKTLASSGDPALLRRFISGVTINTGEGGATQPNWLLTDWYRRQLTGLLPESHPVRADVTGLFQPASGRDTPESRAQTMVEAWKNMRAQVGGGAQAERLYPMEGMIESLMKGEVSPVGRGAGERLSRESAVKMLAPLAPAPTASMVPRYETVSAGDSFVTAPVLPPQRYETVSAGDSFVTVPVSGLPPAPAEPAAGTPEWYAKYVPL